MALIFVSHNRLMQVGGIRVLQSFGLRNQIFFSSFLEKLLWGYLPAMPIPAERRALSLNCKLHCSEPHPTINWKLSNALWTWARLGRLFLKLFLSAEGMQARILKQRFKWKTTHSNWLNFLVSFFIEVDSFDFYVPLRNRFKRQADFRIFFETFSTTFCNFFSGFRFLF